MDPATPAPMGRTTPRYAAVLHGGRLCCRHLTLVRVRVLQAELQKHMAGVNLQADGAADADGKGKGKAGGFPSGMSVPYTGGNQIFAQQQMQRTFCEPHSCSQLSMFCP